MMMMMMMMMIVVIMMMMIMIDNDYEDEMLPWNMLVCQIGMTLNKHTQLVIEK